MKVTSISEIPKTFKEILTRQDKQHWLAATDEELRSLDKNGTWELVPKPDNTNIVGFRWVFNIKLDENGQIAKYKARLVAKGFTQEYGVDYEETFAPVARMSSFRFILALANQYNLMVHMDCFLKWKIGGRNIYANS